MRPSGSPSVLDSAIKIKSGHIVMKGQMFATQDPSTKIKRLKSARPIKRPRENSKVRLQYGQNEPSQKFVISQPKTLK